MALEAIKADTHGAIEWVYPKDEADKVIAELEEKLDTKKKQLNKALDCISNCKNHMMNLARKNNHANYKLCLAMAELCGLDSFHWADDEQEGGWEYKKLRHCIRWKKRWLELAKKFKEHV